MTADILAKAAEALKYIDSCRFMGFEKMGAAEQAAAMEQLREAHKVVEEGERAWQTQRRRK